MKCIIIEGCIDCPLSDFSNNILTCCSALTEPPVRKVSENWLDTPKNLIPEWCPLEDVKDLKDRIRLGEVF